MKKLLKFLAFCVAAFAIMALVGASMTPHHVVTRSMSYAAPPEKVWAAILSIRQLPFDRSDLQALDQGSSARMPDSVEVVGTPVAIAFEEVRPPRDFTVHTVDPGLPYTGTWTFVLSPEPLDLTRLTVTEDAEVHGRLLRFFVRTFRLDDSFVEGIFRAVKRKVAESPRAGG